MAKPIGKGCFTFNSHCMLHGYYVHHKDESADVEEEVLLMSDLEEGEVKSLREGYPKGITPIWRPQKITLFSDELLPPRPNEQKKPPSISSSIGLESEGLPDRESQKKGSEEEINKTGESDLNDPDMKESDEKLEPETTEQKADNEKDIDGDATDAVPASKNGPTSDLQSGDDADV